MSWGMALVPLGLLRATAEIVAAASPDHAKENAYLNSYLRMSSFWRSWIVLEVLGVMIGGFLGAITARRFRRQIERGLKTNQRKRLSLAVFGGIATGFGSRLALGCTSGQALSGGAVLGAGSWLFTLMFFLGVYMFAYFFRKERL
jgi:uncharacterized membrane protein YedE/YeeE